MLGTRGQAVPPKGNLENLSGVIFLQRFQENMI